MRQISIASVNVNQFRADRLVRINLNAALADVDAVLFQEGKGHNVKTIMSATPGLTVLQNNSSKAKQGSGMLFKNSVLQLHSVKGRRRARLWSATPDGFGILARWIYAAIVRPVPTVADPDPKPFVLLVCHRPPWRARALNPTFDKALRKVIAFYRNLGFPVVAALDTNDRSEKKKRAFAASVGGSWHGYDIDGFYVVGAQVVSSRWESSNGASDHPRVYLTIAI